MFTAVKFWLFQVFFMLGTLRFLPHDKRLVESGDEKARDSFVFPIVKNWAAKSLRVAGADVEVTGAENLLPDNTPAVYVGNHQSIFDTFLVLAHIGPKGLLAKKEVEKIPIIGHWLEAFRCVLVDRANPRMAANAFRIASEHVSAGYPMIIFPEGTRSKTGDVMEFKAGAFRIAQKSHVPVVPFCIEGTGGFFEYNGKFALNNSSKLYLHILPAIDTSEYTRDDWKALPALCEVLVRNELSAIREAKN